MEPAEKALELIERFMWYTGIGVIAKQCALITVKEIIAKHYYDFNTYPQYWLDVKEEIKKYPNTLFNPSQL